MSGNTLSAPSDLSRYAWISVAAAVSTIALKSAAFLLTGSVGLLSDAAESLVNLVAALVALAALRVAMRPADDNHHFGHGKAEYFSAGIEGLMILVAASVIVLSAADRLLRPQPLDRLGIGLLITAMAAAINAVVGALLLRAGRTHRSAALTADGHHLFTDVWTSLGVIAGVALVAVTGWERLDPLVAIAVGINILVMGYRLIRASAVALLDAALPASDRAEIEAVLDRFRDDEVSIVEVRTRASGRHRFVHLTVQVPGDWTVDRGHDLADAVERALGEALTDCHTYTHLEPHHAHDPRPSPVGESG